MKMKNNDGNGNDNGNDGVNGYNDDDDVMIIMGKNIAS